MANESDEVSGLKGKTPISYLQEMCNKRGITPQYDLIANEGAVHEPLFVFKVAAGEYIGTGKGTSKKKAKHNAAISLLNQMGVLPALLNGQSSSANGSGGHFSMQPKENDGRNPVGELQEMTQKRLWPPPVYEFTNEIGPAHAREFICNIRLFNICEQAVGKSKKLAKRNAALTMLNAIRLGGVEPIIQVVEPDEYEDEEPIALNGPVDDENDTHQKATKQHDGSSLCQPKFLSSHYAHQDTGGDGETDRVKKKISPMFLMSSKKTKVGPVLEALQSLSDEDLNTDDVCKRLEDLALEQKFTVTYLDLPEKSLSGKYQCIVNLSTNPQTACFGSSTDSADDARVAAALNALQHCRIMTTRTNM